MQVKHKTTLYFLATFMLSWATSVSAQDFFQLRVEPSTLQSVPAIHSGAFGTYNGHWFFIGGRTNGLHGFQPPFAFPSNGINDKIYFTNPDLDSTWSVDVYSLPDSIREPITSSNMQFYLHNSMLYIVGGYGWKDGIQNFVTWPTLTAINLAGLLPAVKNQQPITPYFRQITDSVLAVCGAHLQMLDTTYYLVFGHRFDGYYDRSDTTGFHTQEYTHEIRKFQIADDGVNLQLKNYTAIRDTANFRRRDYNLLHLKDPFKGDGLLAYSGVFRKGIDLPYFNCIEIYPDTFIVRNDFSQTLSQYHSAVAELYDSVWWVQHHLFFGGISMYYVDTLTNSTVTDSLVPFVRTISDVARDIDMNYHEFDAGVRMPALLGTNAYFFADKNAPLIHRHFVHTNAMPQGGRIGFLTGGIESPELNISFTDPSLSSCSNKIFEVYLDKSTGIKPTALNNDVLDYYGYPNPTSSVTTIHFQLNREMTLTIELCDINGKVLQQIRNGVFDTGTHVIKVDMNSFSAGTYSIVLKSSTHRRAIKVVKK